MFQNIWTQIQERQSFLLQKYFFFKGGKNINIEGQKPTFWCVQYEKLLKPMNQKHYHKFFFISELSFTDGQTYPKYGPALLLLRQERERGRKWGRYINREREMGKWEREREKKERESEVERKRDSVCVWERERER